MKQCIIVGNGSSTLKEKFGSYIDSFENVVRFNRFKTKGFESNIGTKCTHWVLNYKLTTDHRNYLVKNLSRVKSETTNLKQSLILTTAKDDGKLKKIKKLVDLEVIYQNFDLFFGSKPSTGLLAIKYFLTLFPQITLIGFDFGKSNHYWGNHSISDIPGNHLWKKEKDYVQNLIEQNKVIIK